MRTRTIRRISQIVFFGLFLVLIYATAYPLKPGIPVDLFVRLDPLAAAASMLAARALIAVMWPALVVVGITILLGRVFCGWVCPLGTTLDASDKLFFRGKRRGAVQLRGLKYYILAGLLVSALFSTQAVYLLDPLSLLTRTIVLVFVAPIQMAFRWLAEMFYGWSSGGLGPMASVAAWLSDRAGAWQFISGPQLYFRQGLLVLAVFVAIIGLNSLSRRFWCRNLCPLGALLGLLSYVPILKRVVSKECIDCAKCTSCKMAAIHENPRLTRTAECIECFNCVPICPTDAVSFRFRPKPDLHPETRLSLPRRRILQGAAVGLGFAAMVRIDPGRKRALGETSSVKLSSQELIRPPGSVEESEFVARCIRCGECMKVCPTNGLQPALHEAGIEGFWTPILVPRIGCCTQECNACGEVCPTDAVRPFKIEEKKHIFIATAVIERDQCIAWNSNRTCLVCDEYCSYKAVEWKTVEGTKRPFVNEKVCVGCGICESACPIQPVAAIRVYSFGDKRHMTREEQRAWSEE
ncbi:MAG TPA: 4Fe-4S binding protein [Armatimonadota bacterium]|nr:4Fe-4S binding protein [Armatimonadota bacterium]